MSLGGFEPEGYLYLHEVVWFVAQKGAKGLLSRDFGFVLPGDIADPLDQPAEVVARDALGQKLASGSLIAIALLSPSGRCVPLPAVYWRSDGGTWTMQHQDAVIDLRYFGIQDEVARAILRIDDVRVAFGLQSATPSARVTTEQPPPTQAQEQPQAAPTDCSTASNPVATQDLVDPTPIPEAPAVPAATLLEHIADVGNHVSASKVESGEEGSLSPPLSQKGRPGVEKICLELFQDRRLKQLPLQSSARAEARMFLKDWPKGTIQKPTAKTAAQHISATYKAWKAKNPQ